MNDPVLLLLVHVAATLFMTGLIWFVQVVHYPMFASVGREHFSAYETEHSGRTAWVVGPVMLIEAVTGIMLVSRLPDGASQRAMLSALLLLVVIWLSTALLQVPRHRQLALGFDDVAHRTLVSTNIVRTVAWSARSILLLIVLSGMVHRGMEAF